MLHTTQHTGNSILLPRSILHTSPQPFPLTSSLTITLAVGHSSSRYIQCTVRNMLLLKVISITNYFGSRQTKPAMNQSVSLTLTHNRTAYGNVATGLAVSMYGSRHCNTLGQSSPSHPSSHCDTLPLACYDRAFTLVPITLLNLSHFLGRHYLCIGRPSDKDIWTLICFTTKAITSIWLIYLMTLHVTCPQGLSQLCTTVWNRKISNRHFSRGWIQF